MFVLELHASDVHAALGRLLGQARVGDLELTAVSAQADEGEYTIRASHAVRDRDVVDRLARRISSLFRVGVIEIRGECWRALPARSAAAP